MISEKQIVQCLQCDRLKSSTGNWYVENQEYIKGDISHTYCPDCITVLQTRLMAARNFVDWDFDRQIEFLHDDLARHEKKFDRPSLKKYLEEFFCIESTNYEKFYEALQGDLANAVCPNCHREVDALNEHKFFGPHILHPKCSKEIDNKIKIIVDNNWAQSDKFSAYLDLLKIEKSIRPELKEVLKRKRSHEALKI